MSERLEPRTIKEAHTYVEMTPCRHCGRVDRAAKGALRFEGDRTVKHHAWACSGCGTQREFTFVYPPGDDYMQVEGYGPDGVPSRLLDAGQFLTLSDRYAQSVPASPSGEAETQRAAAAMQEAIACLEEVLKFIGPGPDDEPPAHALRSTASQRMQRELPGQFRRARLEARLKAYRGMLSGFQGGGAEDEGAFRTEAIDMNSVLEAHARLQNTSGGGGASAGSGSAQDHPMVKALKPRTKPTEWDEWLDVQVDKELRAGEVELMRLAGCSPWALFLKRLAPSYYVVLTTQRVLLFKTKRLKGWRIRFDKAVKKVESIELADIKQVVTVKALGAMWLVGGRGVRFELHDGKSRTIAGRRSGMFSDAKGDYLDFPSRVARAMTHLPNQLPPG